MKFPRALLLVAMIVGGAIATSIVAVATVAMAIEPAAAGKLSEVFTPAGISAIVDLLTLMLAVIDYSLVSYENNFADLSRLF